MMMQPWWIDAWQVTKCGWQVIFLYVDVNFY